ncbi:GFA family protein [Curvivirga sp.]|uniref:GFA family protein n=1 Tax=Curvivirga sp. TaxID=2856848 RepID=UPI003B58E8E1
MKAHGSCLCKAVEFSFEVKDKHFDACHCSVCRGWGGGPSFTVEVAGELELKGEENVSLYESSDWAERGFCKKCGTNLFYRLKDKSHNYCNFNLGTLQGHEEFEFRTQIFTDSKPDNYSFANQTKEMTEQEVLESFGAG